MFNCNSNFNRNNDCCGECCNDCNPVNEINNCNNNGCDNSLWLIIILFLFCGNNRGNSCGNGCFDGRNNGGCFDGRNNGGCGDWLIIILLMSCCGGNFC